MTQFIRRIVLGFVVALFVFAGFTSAKAQGDVKKGAMRAFINVYAPHDEPTPRNVMISVNEILEDARRVVVIRPQLVTISPSHNFWRPAFWSGRRYEVIVADTENRKLIRETWRPTRREVIQVGLPRLSGTSKTEQLASLQKKYDELEASYRGNLTAYGNQGIDLRAAEKRVASLEEGLKSEYQQRIALANELSALKMQRARGEITGFGIRGGINYTGSYEPRLRAAWDMPCYVDFYNDSLYQTRIGMVQVLVKGPGAPSNIAPFTVSLIKENSLYDYWGNSTIELAAWDSTREGWVATILCNEYVEADGHTRPRIRFDSRAFFVQPSGSEVSISVINTWSYDGLSIMVGPDHGSGTVVVQYQQ